MQLIARLLTIPENDWWIVRGEKGSLWESLFLPKCIVAQGTNTKPFDLNLDYAQRQLAMHGLDEYDKREVNDFLDNLDGCGVIVPSAGSRQFGVGIVASEAFVGEELHWQQRRCDWHPHLIDSPTELHRYLTALGLRGTIFRTPPKYVTHIRHAIEAIS